jgi:PKD repeat protein
VLISHTYPNPGNYTATLTVTDDQDVSTTANAIIEVTPPPVPPTIISQPQNQTVKVGQSATFSVAADGTEPLGYQWQKNGMDIEGATAESHITPATTLADDGSTFRCVVSNAADSATSETATLTVLPNQPPIAEFAASPVFGEAPLTVNFDASASSDPDGTIASYAWDFGDGETGTGMLTSHTYSNPDTYTVTLAVTDDSAASHSTSVTISVTPAPPRITLQPLNLSIKVGQSATFSVAADGTEPLGYQWQKNGMDIEGATAESHITPATTLADNGSTFRCVVSNVAGSATSETATLTVLANLPPLATFTAAPLLGYAPLSVDFDASASSDPDGSIASYAWNFGDGETGTGVLTSHTYPNPGTYTVTLTVGDDQQATHSATTTVTVEETPVIVRVKDGLQALYIFEEETGTIVGDISGIAPPLDLTIGNAQAVTWNEGRLTVNSPVTIASAGAATRLVSAIKASNEITIEAWIKPVNVTQYGPARIVTLSASTLARNFTLGQGLWGTYPSNLYNVRFRTTATTLNGQPSPSTPAGSLTTALTHVVYTRTSAGAVRIYLDGSLITTGNSSGDSSNWDASYRLALANELTGDRPWLGEFHLVAIYSRALSESDVSQNFAAGSAAGANLPPVAAFTATPLTGEAPLTLAFDASAASDPDGTIMAYSWDFGDGNGGTGTLTSHTYPDPGTYTAQLTVTDNQQATAFAATSVEVTGEPVPDSVQQWQVFEKSLSSTNLYSNAQKYSDVTLTATFSGPAGEEISVPGFWDGDTSWTVRFAPPSPGTWSYAISSSDAQLDASTNDGTFTALVPTPADVANNPNNRGFLKISANNRHFTYADGTPFFWMGGTNWHADQRCEFTDTEFKRYILDRKAKKFTVIQLNVGWPGPETAGNEGGTVFTQEYNEINPAHFLWLDRRLIYIVDNGMVPVLFFGWTDAIYNSMSIAQINAYITYLVARYNALNVVWCLAGEYGLRNSMIPIVAAGEHLNRVDGSAHLTTIHPGPNPANLSSMEDFRYSTAIDFHMQHTWADSEHDLMVSDYAQNDGPIVNAEAGYDGLWEHDRERVRQEAWTVICSGGAGYTYGAHGIWNWQKSAEPFWYNVIDLPSSHDMTRLAEFFAGGYWSELSPRDDLVSSGHCLAVPGQRYVIYLKTGGPTTVTGLSGGITASWYNPRTGTSQAAGSGPNFQAPDSNDWVLSIIISP